MTVTDLRQITDSGCNVKKHSLSLNKLKRNLKKGTTVAAVIGIAICLFPAGAQAQLIRRANFVDASPVFFTSGGDAVIIFNPEMGGTLGTSEELVSDSDISLNLRYRRFSPDTKDVNSLDSQGEFPKAIEGLEVVTNNKDLNFSSQNVTLLTSRLAIDPNTGNFPGLSFGYQAITDNNPFATFNNDGIRYDFTFANRSETLTLFIPSSFFPPFAPGSIILTPNGNNATDPINSIFYLSTVLDNISLAKGVQGVVKYPELGIEQRFLVTGNQRVLTQRSVNVP